MMRSVGLVAASLSLAACSEPPPTIPTPWTLTVQGPTAVHRGESVRLLVRGLEDEPEVEWFARLMRPQASRAALVVDGFEIEVPVDVRGTYDVEVIARSVDRMEVAVHSVVLGNTPPELEIEGPTEVIVGRRASLHADATDADGDPMLFTWSIVEQPVDSELVLEPPFGAYLDVYASHEGTYTLELEVVDPQAAATTKRVSFVASESGRMYADAGDDQWLLAGARAELFGRFSSREPVTRASFQWTLVERPPDSSAELVDSGQADLSFSTDVPGAYRLHLVVSNAAQSSEPDEVVVRAAPPATDANTFDPARVYFAGSLQGMQAMADVEAPDAARVGFDRRGAPMIGFVHPTERALVYARLDETFRRVTEWRRFACDECVGDPRLPYPENAEANDPLVATDLCEGVAPIFLMPTPEGELVGHCGGYVYDSPSGSITTQDVLLFGVARGRVAIGHRDRMIVLVSLDTGEEIATSFPEYRVVAVRVDAVEGFEVVRLDEAFVRRELVHLHEDGSEELLGEYPDLSPGCFSRGTLDGSDRLYVICGSAPRSIRRVGLDGSDVELYREGPERRLGLAGLTLLTGP